MSNIVYIQANIFPIAALLVVMNNLKRDMSFSWRRHCLETIMKLTVCIMIFNVVCWCLNGREGNLAKGILWVGNTAYYVFMLYMAFLWFLYVYDKVTNGNGQMGISMFVKAIPLVISLVILAAGVVRPLIFYIDAENLYQRGPLHILSTVVAAGYIFVACILAFVGMLRTQEREERRQYGYLVLFGVFPLVGGIVQMFLYGTDLLWPMTSVALVMVYINIQQQNVSRDSMTGLNNRRRLDQYIAALSKEHIKEPLCYSIMDIDYFKEINDNFGHQTGDKVLCLVANALKKVYGNTRSFIARYGGDEFVIISRGFDSEQAEHYRGRLERMIKDIECEELENGGLEISMGCAYYGEEGCKQVRDMMELADMRMYDIKNEHHNNNAALMWQKRG